VPDRNGFDPLGTGHDYGACCRLDVFVFIDNVAGLPVNSWSMGLDFEMQYDGCINVFREVLLATNRRNTYH